jgi:peptidyl-Lys metalloendopeptidase
MHPNPIRLAAGIVVLWMSTSASAHAADITVSITPAQQTLSRDDDVLVKVTLTNTSAAPVHLLKWRLPSDDMDAPLFEVTRDGLKARYLGIRAKRAAPTHGDYIVLAPGASQSATVELSSQYEMTVTGAYTVRYRAGSPQLYGANEVRRDAGELASEAVSIWIDGRLPRGTITPEPLPQGAQAGAGLSFKSCSNAQQGSVTSGAAAGLAMATDGEAYMGKAALAKRYGEWFGADDAGRAATVQAHFTAIRDAFASKPVTVDCSCNKSYYAYVYPARPYVIHVCRAFWSAPLAGTDSKGGTLVHEMSHFNVVAGTDDWVYGQSGAASLAASDPARAVDNADSHEYFGENTPLLPVK